MDEVQESMNRIRTAFLEDPELYKALVASIKSATDEWLFGEEEFLKKRDKPLYEAIADRIIGK